MIGLAVWVAVPLLTNDPYIIQIVFMVSIFSIFASSLNIAIGYTGLASMSHATFFGIGAYVTALLATKVRIPFYITLLLSGAVALVFGLMLGIPTLRLKGFYLGLLTISFGEIIRMVELNWVSVTRGPMGIPGIPNASIGKLQFTPVTFCYYALVVLLLELEAMRRIADSRIGRALFAIKNDQLAANALGVNVTHYKVLAFALSAFFAGMAGSIYTYYIMFVSPDSFTRADSIKALCMVILGGSGTLLGPVLGALVLIALPEFLRFANLYRLVFLGATMVITIIVKESGAGERITQWVESRIASFRKGEVKV
jgi:branched-chain amino acid transport system permease protein